jgi:putative transposase
MRLPWASGRSGRQRARYPGPEPTRTAKAAKRFFRKLLKGLHYVPRMIITDKLKSYGAAKREILPGVVHRQHKFLNNRAEHSHQPTRPREKKMRNSNQQNKCNGFFPLIAPITGISNHGGTAYVQGNTMLFYRVDSSNGMR